MAQRWPALNILVHTIGPGAGRFEQLDDAGWDEASPSAPCPASAASGPRCPPSGPPNGAHLHLLGPLGAAPEPADRRLYGGQVGRLEHFEEPGQVAGPEGILVNTICPGTIVTASFTENLHEIFAAENLDPTDPHDVMHWIDEHFHQPADVGRAGLPDEVATITAYLVSRRNGYVTGASVNVDGGSDFI